MDDPLIDIRNSASLNTGITKRSHSLSNTCVSPEPKPAIALIGIKGIPSVFFAGVILYGKPCVPSFGEPEFQPQTIVADDLADIEMHNNELHPLQHTFPGMTRKEVFMKCANPELKAIEKWKLYWANS